MNGRPPYKKIYTVATKTVGVEVFCDAQVAHKGGVVDVDERSKKHGRIIKK